MHKNIRISGIFAAVAWAASLGLTSAVWAADTLSLDEVKTAASVRFDALEKDKDGTLDATEVKGLTGPKTFKAADPDNDGTLSKDEYLALVEQLFKEADTDGDGTLSVGELHTRAGMALEKLVK